MAQPVEFDFVLPRGYTSPDGYVHRAGRMRMALAIDEIEALNDPRVQANEAYLPVILFSRVVLALGDLSTITPQVIESLYVADFAYLEDLYTRINGQEPITVAAICPHCSGQFKLQVAPLNSIPQT